MLGGVTHTAIESAMRPSQRIFSLSVMIKSPASPAVGVVTKTAIASQATLVMVILVTARACDGSSFVRRGLMAFLARNDRVSAYQRKASKIVVEASRLSPAGVLVTFFTPGPELPLMRIVLLVTRDACSGQFVAKRADVAGIAFDFHMRAAQGILCFIVIESGVFPVTLAVTRFTFGPVAAGVNILNLMTGDASCTDTGVPFASMAE